MKRKKGICELESGHAVRAEFDVEESQNENETTYSHPFTGELCETIEFEPDDEDKR